MNVSSFVELQISSELERFFLQQLHIRSGEKFEGRVIEVRTDGKALVDFGRFRALAEVKFPVQAGETLHVRVEEKGERLKMALEFPARLPGGEESAGVGRPVRLEAVPGDLPLRLGRAVEQALRGATELPAALRTLLARVADHVAPLDPTAPPLRLVASLRARLENGGVLLEKRLEAAVERAVAAGVAPAARELAAAGGVREVLQTDLKATLLQLANWLEPDAAPAAVANRAQLRELVDTALAGLSQQQRQAANAAGTDEPVLLTFQLPLAGGLRPARLKAYFPKRRGGRGRGGFHLALLLVLERLGELRTDFLMAERKLSVTFFTASERAAERLEAHLDELRVALAGLFAWLSVQVRVDGEKVAAFDSEDWPSDGQRLVDVRA